eukprot:980186-Amphidinium_carterae.1
MDLITSTQRDGSDGLAAYLRNRRIHLHRLRWWGRGSPSVSVLWLMACLKRGKAKGGSARIGVAAHCQVEVDGLSDASPANPLVKPRWAEDHPNGWVSAGPWLGKVVQRALLLGHEGKSLGQQQHQRCIQTERNN